MRVGASVALMALLGLTGCGLPSAFRCESNADCQRGSQEAGRCETVGYCSFPDLACESGQRFGEFSDVLGGKCVPPSGGMGTTGGSASAEGTTGSSGAGETTEPTTTTLEPTTAALTSTGSSTTGEATAGESSTGTVEGADLVLWLDFESGDADKSEYNHAVSCSTVCPTGGPGPFGSAAIFDDQYLEVAAHPALEFSGPFTLTVWVRVDEMNPLGRATIVSQEYGEGDVSYDVSAQDLDGDAAFDLVLASEGVGTGVPDVLEPEAWTFVAVRFAENDQRVQVDGEQVSEDTLRAPSVQLAPLTIGGMPTIGFPFIGGIDDLRLYRRVLTDEELSAVRAGEAVD